MAEISQINDSELEKNPENSEFSGILKHIEEEKNKIVSGVGNIGFAKSIPLWEEMRNQCTDILNAEANTQEKNEAQKKLVELEGLEITAFSEKISKTLKESTWKESQKVYTDLLQKLDNSSIQQTTKQQILSHLTENLEITNQNLQEKEFISTQEEREKNILSSLSYAQSLSEWKDLITKYESQFNSTPLEKYKEKYTKKISELKENYFVATQESTEKKILLNSSYKKSLPQWKELITLYETQLTICNSAKHTARYREKINDIKANECIAKGYTTLKDRKKDKNINWEQSQKIYKNLKKETENNPHLSSPQKKTEKKDLLSEISDALNIAEINSQLKEKKFYLLEREEILLEKGYRESKNGWEKTATEYKNILKRKDLPEKYREIFEQKAKEMESNFETASLHADLENQKESSDSWEASEKKYTKILDATSSNKKISKSEKHDLLAKGNEYLETAESNVLIKELKTNTEEKILYAETHLDWEDSEIFHKKLQEEITQTTSAINENLLSPNNKKDISEISGKIAQNIQTCTAEQKADTQSEKIFHPELLAEEYPEFAYLQKIFLATAYQKTDPKILEQKNKTEKSIEEEKISPAFSGIQRAENTENPNISEENIPDTEISAEDIQKQQIQEMQTSPDERKTHTLDISSTGISAASSELSSANTAVENSVQNSIKILLVDSETGVQLNSPESQKKAFAKTMKATLPPEISKNFSTQQIENYLSQESQRQVLKTQVID